MKRRTKLILIHLVVVGLLAAIVWGWLPYQCFFKALIGFDCPACVTTRAIASLLMGDVTMYLQYNPMAVPLVLLLLYAVHRNHLSITKRIQDVILIIGTIIVFIGYLIRLGKLI